MEENMENFKTPDLGEASLLLCLGFELKGFERPEEYRRKLTMIFSGHSEKTDQKIDEIISRYRIRKPILVDAYSLISAEREMKSRIHAELEYNV